jgi:NADPH:quinone reductase-like Zn-dependent oxidoreductase
MLECIGGSMTASLIECMPPRSTCILYGSFREVGLEGFDPLVFIGRDLKIEGFILAQYIKSKGLIGILPLINKAVSLMNDSTLHSTIQRRVKFSEFKDSLSDYYKNMTGGKFVLCPHDLDEKLLKPSADLLKEFEIKHLNSD